MFCCTLLYVHSSIAIILMGKRELVALLNLSTWCLVMVSRLFLAVPQGCLRFVIVVFPDHTKLLFLKKRSYDIILHFIKIVRLFLQWPQMATKHHVLNHMQADYRCVKKNTQNVNKLENKKGNLDGG